MVYRVLIACCLLVILSSGCTKSGSEVTPTQPHYSVQATPLLGGMTTAYHITDHHKNILYSYAQWPKEKDLKLYLTIDLTSAGQETLTFTEIKE